MSTLEAMSKRTGRKKRPPIIIGGVEVGPGERLTIFALGQPFHDVVHIKVGKLVAQRG